MVEVVRHAMAASEVLFPGAPWLFPSRSSKTGEVIATQVWKEKALPSETGHILRHTYRTVAQRRGIDRVNARLLLDHTVPGIEGVYIHERALFDTLLAEQERVTAAILALLEPSTTIDWGLESGNWGLPRRAAEGNLGADYESVSAFRGCRARGAPHAGGAGQPECQACHQSDRCHSRRSGMVSIRGPEHD